MDKIQKLLKRLGPKEYEAVRDALLALQQGQTGGLDIKKLRGHSNVYRVRVQSLRIIFVQTDSGIEILEIARRNESTYRDF